MDPRWADRASRCFLLCRTGGGISEGRGSVCLPQPWSQPSLGISLWVDELVSRAASGYGHLGGGVRAILGILLPYVGHALVHKSPWEVRVYLHHSATAGGVGRGGRDGYQLLQCADEWRDPGCADVPKDRDDLAHCCRRNAIRNAERKQSGGNGRAVWFWNNRRFTHRLGSRDVGLQRLQ